MRIMGIDPGEKRLGIATSDPSGIIANLLMVLKSTSRAINAATIAQIALDKQAELIVVGQSLDEEGEPTAEGRRAQRLAEAIHQQTNIPVLLWDEGESTQMARSASIAMGISSRKRRSRGHHVDDLAATVILQSYLDAQASQGKP